MKKNRLRLLADIYFTFLKLGSVSFGGGYAMLSLIEREVVKEKKWVDKEKIIDIFAVSESLPGAIALNSSAFVGYSIAGIPGAVAALLGNLTSPVIIVLTLMIIFANIKDYPAVQSAFRGIFPTIAGLILYAAYKIGKTAVIDYSTAIIVIASFCAAVFLNVAPIPLIISGAVIGISLMCIRNVFRKMQGRSSD
ncbi:MAG TPA: chromate transporter [Clostridia bacterium]